MTTTIDGLNARGQGYLPGMFGIEFLSTEPGRLIELNPPETSKLFLNQSL